MITRLKCILLLLLIGICAVSSQFADCYNGSVPQRCEPEQESFSFAITPLVSSTCTAGDDLYCARHANGSFYCNDCSGDYSPSLITDFFSPITPNTWWQSQLNVTTVTIRITMETLVQIQGLRFDFVSLKPDSFYVLKSQTNTADLVPFHYFSTDCLSSYLIDPDPSLVSTNETVPLCQAITGQDYLPGQISFVPELDRPSFYDPVPGLSYQLYDFVTARIVEVVLDGFSTHSINISEHFYGLEDLTVLGKCQCHGHSNRCNKINGYWLCDCRHHTAGDNCERCKDFYHDLPWKVANGGAPFECKSKSRNSNT